MKKWIFFLITTLSIGSAIAKNIQLENTQANCNKVDSVSQGDDVAIAAKYKVSVSSVRLISVSWGSTPYGAPSCIFTFDTAKGPKKCMSLSKLMSDDGGKTAFAGIAYMGNVESNCW